MLACRLRTCLFAALLVALLAEAAAAPRSRRQLADDNTLQPIDEENEELEREKRKLEGVTQAKYTVKNAVLGFVFGKLNSFIDAKTRLVESLDKKNIELNKQYGIEPPQNGLASLTGVVSQVVGPKLQYLAPKLQAASGLLGGLSSGSSGSGSSGGGSGWRYVAPPAPIEHRKTHYGENRAHIEDTRAHFEDGRAHFAHGRGQFDSRTPRVEAADVRHEAGWWHSGSQTTEAGHEEFRGYPSVRPEQGQPGSTGEPVWAFRLTPHQHH
ncbi:uncharacterized protein LOC125051823 isoform X1 [Pieris napi]|uniref:uncharacterized protein LOC125051823 isoform X1 n=1 Tax=Pieris napi TaxID=78633 RepID=UPI001FB9B103|nr:uncharacterized protein LOC125051823 isoform X1 [Pieris napi]